MSIDVREMAGLVTAQGVFDTTHVRMVDPDVVSSAIRSSVSGLVREATREDLTPAEVFYVELHLLAALSEIETRIELMHDYTSKGSEHGSKTY